MFQPGGVQGGDDRLRPQNGGDIDIIDGDLHQRVAHAAADEPGAIRAPRRLERGEDGAGLGRILPGLVFEASGHAG